ncbi:hypothetical protein ACMWQU_27465, partial [Escherichia coli]|uniref:hypothetical protein n=1 Tax=Escherichia coli TaxID=562 RepID=UPI0039E1371D
VTDKIARCLAGREIARGGYVSKIGIVDRNAWNLSLANDCLGQFVGTVENENRFDLDVVGFGVAACLTEACD